MYESFCYLQHYFAAGTLAPISKSVSLCSAVPSFSEIISILSSGFHEEPQEYILKKKNFFTLFLWMGFNFLKATEPLRGDSLLFTSKSLGVSGTYLIYFRKMKGQHIL